MLNKVVDALSLLKKHEIFIMAKEELLRLESVDTDTEKKAETGTRGQEPCPTSCFLDY